MAAIIPQEALYITDLHKPFGTYAGVTYARV